MVFEYIFGKAKRETVSDAISQEINNYRRPSVVYRYCSINKYLYDTIETKTIYLPSYSDLNDPCEGFYDVFFSWDTENFAAAFQIMRIFQIDRKTFDIIAKEYGEDAAKMAHQVINSEDSGTIDLLQKMFLITGNKFNGAFKRCQREIDLKNIRVFSLSSHSASPVMCHNYADQGRGVCLGFSTDNEPFSSIMPVIYRKTPLIMNPMGTEQEQLVGRMCIKHTDWEVEKEWRIIGHRSKLEGENFLPISLKNLKSVTFCKNVCELEKNKLLNHLNKFGWKPINGSNVFKFTTDENRSSYDLIRSGEL